MLFSSFRVRNSYIPSLQILLSIWKEVLPLQGSKTVTTHLIHIYMSGKIWIFYR